MFRRQLVIIGANVGCVERVGVVGGGGVVGGASTVPSNIVS